MQELNPSIKTGLPVCRIKTQLTMITPRERNKIMYPYNVCVWMFQGGLSLCNSNQSSVMVNKDQIQESEKKGSNRVNKQAGAL